MKPRCASAPAEDPVPRCWRTSPQVRQDVDLILPGRERFAARVTRIGEDEVVLVLLLEARDPVQLGDVAEMAMEFAGPRGLVRIEGSGSVADYDVVDPQPLGRDRGRAATRLRARQSGAADGARARSTWRARSATG